MLTALLGASGGPGWGSAPLNCLAGQRQVVAVAVVLCDHEELPPTQGARQTGAGRPQVTSSVRRRMGRAPKFCARLQQTAFALRCPTYPNTVAAFYKVRGASDRVCRSAPATWRPERRLGQSQRASRTMAGPGSQRNKVCRPPAAAHMPCSSSSRVQGLRAALPALTELIAVHAVWHSCVSCAACPAAAAAAAAAAVFTLCLQTPADPALQPHKAGRKAGLSAREKHRNTKGALAEPPCCCWASLCTCAPWPCPPPQSYSLLPCLLHLHACTCMPAAGPVMLKTFSQFA